MMSSMSSRNTRENCLDFQRTSRLQTVRSNLNAAYREARIQSRQDSTKTVRQRDAVFTALTANVNTLEHDEMPGRLPSIISVTFKLACNRGLSSEFSCYEASTLTAMTKYNSARDGIFGSSFAQNADDGSTDYRQALDGPRFLDPEGPIRTACFR